MKTTKIHHSVANWTGNWFIHGERYKSIAPLKIVFVVVVVVVVSGFFLFVAGIGFMSRVFVNGPGDCGSIPGQVIPKTQKMVLDTSLFNTQHYKIKWSNPRNGVAPSLTPRCSSYRKGSFRVTLDNGRQLLQSHMYKKIMKILVRYTYTSRTHTYMHLNTYHTHTYYYASTYTHTHVHTHNAHIYSYTSHTHKSHTHIHPITYNHVHAHTSCAYMHITPNTHINTYMHACMYISRFFLI